MNPFNVKLLFTFILKSWSLQDTIRMKEANGTNSHIFKEVRLSGIYDQIVWTRVWGLFSLQPQAYSFLSCGLTSLWWETVQWARKKWWEKDHRWCLGIIVFRPRALAHSQRASLSLIQAGILKGETCQWAFYHYKYSPIEYLQNYIEYSLFHLAFIS